MNKINDIKILESNINNLQVQINNLNDEYANIFDVLEDLQNKIDDIKCLLEKKVNELYKQEINNIKIVNK